MKTLLLGIPGVGCMMASNVQRETAAQDATTQYVRIAHQDAVKASWNVSGRTLDGSLTWADACTREVSTSTEVQDVTVRKPDILWTSFWLGLSLAAVGGAGYLAAVEAPKASTKETCDDANNCASPQATLYGTAAILGIIGLGGTVWTIATFARKDETKVNSTQTRWDKSVDRRAVPCARQEALTGTRVTLEMSGFEPLGATVDGNGSFSVTLPEARDGRRRPSTAEVRIGDVGASAARLLETGSLVGIVDLSSYAAGGKESEQREEAQWREVGHTECRVPSSPKACDKMRGFLASYPRGVHADEARNALSAAQPKLDQLQNDENKWRVAGAERCNIKRDTESCIGMELYLNNFPAGLHSDEARAALAAKAPPPTAAPPKRRTTR